MPKSTKITKAEIISRIQNSFPKSSFELLEYTDTKKPIKLKCKKCGKVIEAKSVERIIYKVNFCSCEKDFKNTKEKVNFLLDARDFELLEWINSGEKIKIKCKNCSAEFSRYAQEIFRNPGYCPSCNNSITMPMNIEEVQKKIDNVFGKNTYELLDYKNWRTKVHIKHIKCNLIFEQNIGHFLDGCGCPKCYRKRSKGEQIIEKWLEDKKINFISQYRIIYKNNSIGYCDFYLPEKNIVIEYNGEQHYNKDNLFNKHNGFDKQQERDNKKREYCFCNNIKLIEIPYWELKNINEILDLQFNDYSLTEVGLNDPKCLTSKDEDIV